MNEKFQSNLHAVMREFGLSEEEVFERTKRRMNVDARQVLFLMCRNDKIPLNYIQKYSFNKGLHLSHSTIIHGARRAKNVFSNDPYIRDLIGDESK